MRLHLNPYFVYAGSEGYDDTALCTDSSEPSLLNDAICDKIVKYLITSEMTNIH